MLGKIGLQQGKNALREGIHGLEMGIMEVFYSFFGIIHQLSSFLLSKNSVAGR